MRIDCLRPSLAACSSRSPRPAVTWGRRPAGAGALAAALALLVSAQAMAADPRFDGVRALIAKEMADGDVPAMSLAVAKDGRILWEEGFGKADRENNIDADQNTMYSLASVTKTFTATGLMTLVQAGKVDLDRPINDYFGEAKLTARVGDINQVTVRRVANHTSGLGTAEQFFYGEAERKLVPSMDQSITRYGNIVREPGSRYSYNNFGYGLLDYVVERVSGTPFADYMRQNVYLPLDMTHSSIGVAPGLERYAAVRYGPKRERIPDYAFAEPGAAAMYSSAHDLVRYGMFVQGQRVPGQKAILNRRSLDAMIEGAVDEGDGSGYGIGMQVVDVGKYRWIGHGGSMSGVSTTLMMVPSEGITVVVLGNLSGAPVGKVSQAILKTLLPDWGRPEVAKATPAAPPKPAPELDAAVALPATLTGDWRGVVKTYEGDIPAVLRVLPSGQVHLRINDQLWSLVNGVQFEDGRLSGRALSHLQTQDVSRRRHAVRLDLKLDGDTLNGEAMAGSGPVGAAGVQDPYFVFGLNHWMELRRVTAAGATAGE